MAISPQAILLGLIGGPQILQSVLSMYPPFSTGLARKGFADDPNLVPTPGELVTQAQKGIIPKSTFLELMREAGYDGDLAQNMFTNAKGYLAALDYVTAWRRGFMAEGDLTKVMEDQGFELRDINILKQVTIYYPTPQDLVRFGVRDVFTSSTRAEYGLDEDYPDKMDEVAIKAGLTPDISRDYWAAHWELPSPTQAFDMYHRRILTQEQLETYLKAADYMPFWRDKMIKLSYDNLTRVDVRRMYALGVLSETEVNDAYLDIGYSPENAQRLTRYTVLETQHSKEETPQTGVIAAYKAGIYDRSRALQELDKGKIDFQTANMLLDTADAQIKQELIDLESDAYVDQYQRGLIDLNALQSKLTALGVPSRLLQLTVAREIAQGKKRAKSNTKADLDTWWRIGVIGTTKYNRNMDALGYNPSDIKMYLAEMRMDEIAGKDKKYPWAQTLRDYSDGLVSYSAMESTLQNMTEDKDVINELLTLANSLKN